MRFVTCIVRERQLQLYGQVARFPDADPQTQYMTAHTCAPHFILRSDQRWPTDRLVAISVAHKYGPALVLHAAKLLKQPGR